MSYLSNELGQRVHIERVGFEYFDYWPVSYPLRPFWRLYWTSRTGAVWQSENQTFMPDQKQLILTPPNVPLSRELRKPLHHGYIHFSLGMPLDLFRGKVMLVEALPAMRQVWEDLVSDGDCLHRQFLLGKLINHVLLAVPFGEQLNLHADSRITMLLEHMKQNTDRMVPNRELAQLSHLSEAAMIRWFTQRVGKSPQALFSDMRLDEAAGILRRDHERSVEQIAAETGFFDRSHFCKRFAKRFGVSPVVYRKMP